MLKREPSGKKGTKSAFLLLNFKKSDPVLLQFPVYQDEIPVCLHQANGVNQ